MSFFNSNLFKVFYFDRLAGNTYICKYLRRYWSKNYFHSFTCEKRAIFLSAHNCCFDVKCSEMKNKGKDNYKKRKKEEKKGYERKQDPKGKKEEKE